MDNKHTRDTIYSHFKDITDNIYMVLGNLFYPSTTHPLPSTRISTSGDFGHRLVLFVDQATFSHPLLLGLGGLLLSYKY